MVFICGLLDEAGIGVAVLQIPVCGLSAVVTYAFDGVVQLLLVATDSASRTSALVVISASRPSDAREASWVAGSAALHASATMTVR